MAFLRNLLAALLALFIFSFLALWILGSIAASSDAVPEVKANSVLHLNLSGVVVEKAIEDPFRELLDNGPSPISLLDLLEAIEAAKADDNIKGIYLEPQFLSAGYSSLQELRDAIIDFKASGKFVYSYGEYFSEGDYYLISVADSIMLHPEGTLEFNGLAANVTFFKGLFDKLDIEPEIFRVGEYKSYVEPFIRKDMSEENKEQYAALLNSVYDTYIENVAQSIGKAPAVLRNISDQMLVQSPEDAKKHGLIHQIGYEDEMISKIKSAVGLAQDKDVELMSFNQYMKAARSRGYSSNKVAVIVANGDIIMGKADDAVGGDQFAKEIRKARESSSVKAIVLRVNSPGGSLTASDQIWREIVLTKGVKPIIASMSDVAASGGYYIAMPCDTIVAQPNTITGSIGIFGMLFNFGEFLENKIGITVDGVKTGEFSDLMTVTRSLTEEERAIIQRQVESGYKTFTTKAAQARNMEVDELKKHAGGRVWSGTQAKERGLIDLLGSFDDAVEIAAQKAGVEGDYSVRYYPTQKPFIEKLISDLSEAKIRIFNTTPDIIAPYLDRIKQLERVQGLQVRLPGNLEVR